MIDVDQVRQQSPALISGAVHLDNPGGTQMARHAIDRLNHYIQYTNANHGGHFRTSRESDATLDVRTDSRERSGGVVAQPTETYDGVAGDPFGSEGVARLFEMEGGTNVRSVMVHGANRDEVFGIAAAPGASSLATVDRRCALRSSRIVPSTRRR